jgi:putative MATE family efflux protein
MFLKKSIPPLPLSGTRDRDAILRLAVPATVNQISIVFLQTVDTIFIGRLGPLALGAVGLISTLVWNIMVLGEGFSVGLSACISRRMGAGDTKDAVRFLRSGLAFITLLGMIITPVLLVSSMGIFQAIRMPEELYGYAEGYYRWFILFLPIIYLRTSLEAGFRAAGDTRTTMVAGFIINGLNIVLDYCLIFGKFGFPALGMEGAAIASGISICAGTLYQIIMASRHSWSPFAGGALISLSHLGRIIRISIPATAERSAMAVSQLLVMVVAVNPLGGKSVGAFQIVMRLASLSFMPGFGFAIAASTLTGQSLGAGAPERAKRLAWKATAYCVMVMALISLGYYLFPRELSALFTSDPEVLGAVALPLRIYAISGIFLAPTMVLGGSLHGAGDTNYTMMIMVFSRFILRLPLAWMAGVVLGLGLPGVWFAMSFDFLLRGVLLALRTRKGDWKSLKI